MRIAAKLGLFAGGVLFGTAGVKILSSKDAKKAYTHLYPRDGCRAPCEGRRDDDGYDAP